jgi:hypothetical protein
MTDTQPPKLPNTATNPAQAKTTVPDPDYVAMEGSSFSQVLSHLLRKPMSLVYSFKHDTKSPIFVLLLVTLVCLAIFGFVIGIFSAGNQLWVAPVKIIGGILFSCLICLPSLYIFGSLGGMNAKLQDVVGVMLTFIAITSLLLVGFAPVVWLFSTSSNSPVFFGFLTITIWIVCLIFGLRVINRASRCMGGGRGGHLTLWILIFILVTLQMTTTLRPIVGKSDEFINLEEKHFFLGYWFKNMSEPNQSEADKLKKIKVKTWTEAEKQKQKK